MGILTPAFVDPKSGYRYYTFCQKAVVDAIQFCVDLDIPLKQFKAYTNETASWIRYKELVERGTELVEEKIRSMQERLALLKDMQAEIERSEKNYQSDTPALYRLPERACWISPFEGLLGCNEANELMKRLIMDIFRHGLKLGNANGSLLLKKKNRWTQYLFVDLDITTARTAEQDEILYIPAGRYLCRKVGHSGIHQVWDWCRPYLSEEQIGLVIETELFVGDYSFLEPVLEQRCFLKEQDGILPAGR